MSRWARAVRLLTLPAGSRVLDLGCAFGWGTRLLADRYETFGHDLSAEFIRRARRGLPGLTFTVGTADQLPYPDRYFDAVLLLDVLEHVPDDRAVLREIARVLRPAGQLIVSVPNDGLLARLDSLNLYSRLLGPSALPPTDDPSWRASSIHRHYNVEDLRHLFGHDFAIRSVQYTGIGVAEIVNLILLLCFRAVRWLWPVYNVLQYVYFGTYLAEDVIETGPWGYHVMIESVRT